MKQQEIQVLVTFDLPEAHFKRIRDTSDRVKLSMIRAKAAADVPRARWKETEVLFTWDVLPEPDLAPQLKWIQFKRAGVDDYIHHPLAARPDLVATTMSGVINSQMAEYVLMALLAFGQKLPLILEHQLEKKWPAEDDKWKDFMPIELRRSTVGILGYGSIGRQVARLLKTFGARVLATKRDVMHPEDTGYIPEGMGDPHGDFFDRLYPVEALHSLLGESDFVVVTLPLTDATRHILDADAFKAMKETAYLVNVGRGELIDQQALVDALRTQQIAGAALDVFEQEPLPEDDPLWEMDNVIISPHISGLSPHLHEETLNLFIENLNRYVNDLPLYNQIDVNRGY